MLGLAVYSGEGYDSVLAKTMPLIGGGTLFPGEVPTGTALSAARARVGPGPMRKLFEQSTRDATAEGRSERGPGRRIFDLPVTSFDGTCGGAGR